MPVYDENVPICIKNCQRFRIGIRHGQWTLAHPVPSSESVGWLVGCHVGWLVAGLVG